MEVNLTDLVLPTSFNVPIIYLYWFLVLTGVTTANYVAWVRFYTALDTRLVRAYLAFTIISQLMYWFIAGPYFFYANKYPRGTKDRNNKVCIGLVTIFLFADVPMWILDVRIVFFYGWFHVLQGICFVLRTVSFVINANIVWFIYMWKLTKYLHLRSDDGMVLFNRQQEGER